VSVTKNREPPNSRELAAEAQRYRDAVFVLSSMRRAYLKMQITAEDYKFLRHLAIAGYVKEADRQLAKKISEKYKDEREVF
jgi:hypothetical protein